ncbi:hypothetical protein PR048_021366 [Dryococelus australis]|uniref:Uncharacterized protein n=1 Tax=Dryococelus australis TaxID=614101 RepID=A0ABQ9GXZ3_9NEOP|nr:hypothetical protein PR048_021366 [Dryococelus australis]
MVLRCHNNMVDPGRLENRGGWWLLAPMHGTCSRRNFLLLLMFINIMEFQLILQVEFVNTLIRLSLDRESRFLALADSVSGTLVENEDDNVILAACNIIRKTPGILDWMRGSLLRCCHTRIKFGDATLSNLRFLIPLRHLTNIRVSQLSTEAFPDLFLNPTALKTSMSRVAQIYSLTHSPLTQIDELLIIIIIIVLIATNTIVTYKNTWTRDFFSPRSKHINTGDINTRDQRLIAPTRKALNRSVVLPSSRFPVQIRSARLYSLMYKYADINSTLVGCCHSGRRRLDQRYPGGVKYRVDQRLKFVFLLKRRNTAETRAEMGRRGAAPLIERFPIAREPRPLQDFNEFPGEKFGSGAESQCNSISMLGSSRARWPGARDDAVVAERLACSPPTKGNRVQSPAGSPDLRMWETMPLVGGFFLGSPVSPGISLRRCSILTSISLIASQHLAVKRRPNIFIHSLKNCVEFEFVSAYRMWGGDEANIYTTLNLSQITIMTESLSTRWGPRWRSGESSSIPGRAIPRFSHVGIVPDDTVGRRVFPVISRPPSNPSFRHCSILTSITLVVESRPNLFTLHSLFPLDVLVHALWHVDVSDAVRWVVSCSPLCGATSGVLAMRRYGVFVRLCRHSVFVIHSLAIHTTQVHCK